MGVVGWVGLSKFISSHLYTADSYSASEQYESDDSILYSILFIASELSFAGNFSHHRRQIE